MPTEQQQKPSAEENLRGVPVKVRKQLAIDIEAAGGIQDFDKEKRFSLDDILSKKEHIYKDTKHPLRRKIQNLVYTQWKHFPRDKYFEKVLIPFLIRPEAPPSVSSNRSKKPVQEPKARIPESNQPTTPTSNWTTPLKKNTNFQGRSNRTMTMNKLGEKIVKYLPKGIILVVYWVDCKLSNMEIVISEDGYSVKQRKKTPNPKGANELLSHYAWAKDDFNVAVVTLDDEVLTLKNASKQHNIADGWDEKVIVSLDEEVIRSFVDNKGNLSNHIGYNNDGEGHQYITFFLKTTEAHHTIPQKGTFSNDGCTSSTSNGTNDGTSGMDTGDNGAEAVEDVRAEMDGRMNEINDQMRRMMGQMGNFFSSMQQQQQQLANITAHLQSQAKQGQNGNQPAPDNAGSGDLDL